MTNDSFFSNEANEMHAGAIDYETLARWQDEVNEAIGDPKPEDLEGR